MKKILFSQNQKEKIEKIFLEKNKCFYKDIERLNLMDPSLDEPFAKLGYGNEKKEESKDAKVLEKDLLDATYSVKEKIKESKDAKVLELETKIDELKKQTDNLEKEYIESGEDKSFLKDLIEKQSELDKLEKELSDISGNNINNGNKDLVKEDLKENSSKYIELTKGLIKSKNDFSETLGKFINTDNFGNLDHEVKIYKLSDEVLNLVISRGLENQFNEDDIKKIAENLINKNSETEVNVENDLEVGQTEVSQENGRNLETEVSQEEIEGLLSGLSEEKLEDGFLDSVMDDEKEYIIAKNRTKYLEQNKFEIGKSLMSSSDSVLGSLGRGIIFGITKKLGYKVYNKDIGEHVELVKLELLKKMFPRLKNESQERLGEELKSYNGENKNILKLKDQYNSLENKYKEYRKLSEELKKSKKIVDDFEANHTKEELKNLDNKTSNFSKELNLKDNTTIEEQEKLQENKELVLSILEKKRYDKEFLERIWKNYGTIAKTVTVGSLAILASTLGLPIIAIVGAASMTGVGAFAGIKTAWKNIRENKGFLKIKGENISNNGNRMAFDNNEKLLEESDAQIFFDLLKSKMETVVKIEKESNIAGAVGAIGIVAGGLIARGFLGGFNHLSNIQQSKDDENIDNLSNSNSLNWSGQKNPYFKVASDYENTVVDNNSNLTIKDLESGSFSSFDQKYFSEWTPKNRLSLANKLLDNGYIKDNKVIDNSIKVTGEDGKLRSLETKDVVAEAIFHLINKNGDSIKNTEDAIGYINKNPGFLKTIQDSWGKGGVNNDINSDLEIKKQEELIKKFKTTEEGVEMGIESSVKKITEEEITGEDIANLLKTEVNDVFQWKLKFYRDAFAKDFSFTKEIETWTDEDVTRFKQYIGQYEKYLSIKNNYKFSDVINKELTSGIDNVIREKKDIEDSIELINKKIQTHYLAEKMVSNKEGYLECMENVGLIKNAKEIIGKIVKINLLNNYNSLENEELQESQELQDELVKIFIKDLSQQKERLKDLLNNLPKIEAN